MITLTREDMAEPLPIERQVWRLKVTAASDAPSLMPAEIFVYHRRPEGDFNPQDIFECVASPAQMLEIGLKPMIVDDEHQIPYYRSAVMDYPCRNAQEAEDLWAHIQDHVVDMITNYNASQNLVVSATAQIGEPLVAPIIPGPPT